MKNFGEIVHETKELDICGETEVMIHGVSVVDFVDGAEVIGIA